jgi:hypothetical protein
MKLYKKMKMSYCWTNSKFQYKIPDMVQAHLQQLFENIYIYIYISKSLVDFTKKILYSIFQTFQLHRQLHRLEDVINYLYIYIYILHQS